MLFAIPLDINAFVVDHNAVIEFDEIPIHWLNQATNLVVHYGHTSHGSQIIAGLKWLDQNEGHSFMCEDRNSSRVPDPPPQTHPPSLRMWEEGLWPDTATGRLGYWDGSAAQQGTRNVLASGLFDVSGWSWCGQVGDNGWAYIQEYLDVLNSFEQQFPDVKIFYMTGHNVEPGPPNYKQVKYDRLHANNNGIREYCRNNNKILYDFADIESWDFDGNYHAEEDSNCVWCSDYTSGYQNIPPRSESGGGCRISTCAHTHGLNCVIKAKAFWWMMARIAGWPGVDEAPPLSVPAAPTNLRIN